MLIHCDARHGHQRPRIGDGGDTLFAAMKLPAESQTIQRLAAWAAIPAVCTAPTGIRGMHVEHMAALKWACRHPMALAAIARAARILSGCCGRSRWLWR